MVAGVLVVAFPQWTDHGTNAKLIEDVCLDLVMGDEEKGMQMKKNVEKWKGLAGKAAMEGGSLDINLKAFCGLCFSRLLQVAYCDYGKLQQHPLTNSSHFLLGVSTFDSGKVATLELKNAMSAFGDATSSKALSSCPTTNWIESTKANENTTKKNLRHLFYFLKWL
ncbi:hypothetical protein CXB51_006578 [Gossypium anomalum]|uniref:Uncharacterized protein n=1 Tax=Gossypium anomalum TaxID=47600 RepID=A0A8J5ZGT9_9ROSI|nr:hypothetical protein CXB51_006578 [Gossypium anomalum]